jgi:NitT/TauT family transport system ATP-binding protein
MTDPTTAPEAPGLGAPALSFRSVSMVFADGTHAVDDVSCDVYPNEFVTIVGPSGCGKSTLLKIASGLLDQSAGEVIVDRSRIGYVFQDATLLPWRTVRQNVELLAELHGFDRSARTERAQQAIELVGLGGFENHYPKSLSGGMRMRASLARTLTLEPPLFLFDEPFGAVDEITRERLNEETLALFERKRFAGLFITHSISEAVFLSTSVLVMSARPGRIVARFDIPFDYPRQPDLRFDPEFARLSGEISHTLRGAHV